MSPAVETGPGGALDELAKDASSRKRFLRMVGGAGALGALSLVLAACGDDDDEETTSSAASKDEKGSVSSDLEIVNYALTLEHIEADFYAAVLAAGVVTDKAIGEAAKRIGENEQEHVDALTATAKKLGTPAKKPKTDFQAVISGGEKKVLETAASVENLGAAAYLGQAGRIQSKEILAAALAIHSVEARHAAALNRIVGKTVVPDGAFAKPASMEEVLPQVKPFLAS